MRSSPVAAFLIASAGIALFSTMDVLMKGLAIALGTYTALFWRNLVQLAASALLYAGSRPARPGQAAMRVHIVRGAVTTVMALLFFWGLARLPMAQAIALSFVAPLASLYLSAVLLGEHVPRRAVAGSLVAFAGVSTLLLGQAEAALGPDAFRGALAVLASAGCYAFNIVLMRRQALVAGPGEVAFFQALIVTLLLALAAPWLLDAAPAAHWPAIVAGGLLTTGSSLLLAFAYARAPASVLAPTEYGGFLWAAFFGWAVFDEGLSGWTLLGATLIVSGCVLALRGRRRGEAPLEAEA